MTHDNDIILSGDGQLDIEAASEGRKPRIRTAPAYAGGKLDIAWMWEGERLPVIIDLETLNASAGLPFVLNHDIKKPMGTIDTIAKTTTELRAEGPLTHDHTPYGANELIAAKKGFKHRPSVTVYNPTDPSNVVRVGHGEKRFINGRMQEGPFFAVYNGNLRNISLESTPGDRESDTRGSILAQAKGIEPMPETKIDNPQPGNDSDHQTPEQTPDPGQDIKAGASPAPVPPSPSGPAPAPTVITPKGPEENPPANRTHLIEKMYERGDITCDIMAQALDGNWSPAEALKAQKAVNAVHLTHDGRQNVPGYPVSLTGSKSNEPNGDMIMAAAFLMGNCGLQPSDFDQAECRKQGREAVLALDEKVIDAATSGRYRGLRLSDICAHAVETHYNGRSPVQRQRISGLHEDYYDACTEIQPEIDKKLRFRFAEDIRADADTGLSTIGLRNIWALISTATIGKAYDTVPTLWQEICKKASVPNFLKHTVHRVEMLGDFQRLDRIGGEPPHATYMESQTESQIDTWGLMLMTEEFLPLFSVVELVEFDTFLGDRTEDEEIELRVNEGVTFYGVVPTGEEPSECECIGECECEEVEAPEIQVAITTTDLDYYEFGKAVVHGVATCKVDIKSTAHRFARPIPGDCTKLVSAPDGNIKLILKPKKTGEQIVDVLLGGGGGSGQTEFEGKIESENNGVYQVLLYKNTGTDTLPDPIEATTRFLETAEKLEKGTKVGVTWTPMYGYRINHCDK